jgi:polyphosphate glucokinase
MLTLAVDIGGGTIKLSALDPEGEPAAQTVRQKTPKPAEPEAVVELIRRMAATLPEFDRVSVGFPGIVKESVTQNAPNLGNELWRKVPLGQLLSEALGRPVRAVNDVDLQGLGVVRGVGVELVLTLGTGMGAALFTEGVLVPNLELGHHPFRDGKTYEDLVRDTELKRIGKAEWSARVISALEQLDPIFNYDLLHLGGGNAQNIEAQLPANVRLFTLSEALAGALGVWAR